MDDELNFSRFLGCSWYVEISCRPCFLRCQLATFLHPVNLISWTRAYLVYPSGFLSMTTSKRRRQVLKILSVDVRDEGDYIEAGTMTLFAQFNGP